METIPRTFGKDVWQPTGPFTQPKHIRRQVTVKVNPVEDRMCSTIEKVINDLGLVLFESTLSFPQREGSMGRISVDYYLRRQPGAPGDGTRGAFFECAIVGFTSHFTNDPLGKFFFSVDFSTANEGPWLRALYEELALTLKSFHGLGGDALTIDGMDDMEWLRNL